MYYLRPKIVLKWSFQLITRQVWLTAVRPNLNYVEPHMEGWLGGVTVTAAIGVFVGKSLVFSRRWTEYRTIDGHFS